MHIMDHAPGPFTQAKSAPRNHAAVGNAPHCYYGLSNGTDRSIEYCGPLQRIGLEGPDIATFLTPLLQRAPTAHVIIQPDAGLVILALSRTDFLGFQFLSPIERAPLARFLSAVCKTRKARIVEEYNAIELT